MTTFAIQILHNVTPGTRHPDALAIFERFGRDVARCQPGDQLDVVVLMLVTADTAARACDVAFMAGNSPDDRDPAVIEYARAGVRSLSVGDVVVVHTPDGPAAWSCEPFGWESVDLAAFDVAPGHRADGWIIGRSDVARYVHAAATDPRDMSWGL